MVSKIKLDIYHMTIDDEIAQRTLDAMLRLQSLELHRHRPDQLDAILVPGQRHHAAGPSALERPRHQTRDLNTAQLPGRG